MSSAGRVPAVDAAGTGEGTSNNTDTVTLPHPACAHKAPRKWVRLLSALLEGPQTSFELEKAPVYDHSPNSTVSELRKRGLGITTTMVEIAGYAGIATRIAQYTLDVESRERAERLLGGEK